MIRFVALPITITRNFNLSKVRSMQLKTFTPQFADLNPKFVFQFCKLFDKNPSENKNPLQINIERTNQTLAQNFRQTQQHINKNTQSKSFTKKDKFSGSQSQDNFNNYSQYNQIQSEQLGAYQSYHQNKRDFKNRTNRTYNNNYNTNQQFKHKNSSTNNTFQDKIGLAYQNKFSIRSRIMICKGLDEFIELFDNHKNMFNPRMYSIAARKIVNILQHINKLKQKQKKQAFSILAPLIKNIFSIDVMNKQKYQVHAQEIKRFMHFNCKIKQAISQYYPQLKQKYQRFVKLLIERLQELIQTFQIDELVDLQSNLIRLGRQLENYKVYSEILKKKDAIIFNFYTFTNFICIAKALEDYQRKTMDKTTTTTTTMAMSSQLKSKLIKKRVECFKVIFDNAMSEKGILRMDKHLKIHEFLSYAKTCLFFSHGPQIILNSNFRSNFLQNFWNVIQNEKRSNYQSLQPVLRSDKQLLGKLFSVYYLLTKTNNQSIDNQKISLSEQTSKQLKIFLQKVIQRLSPKDKKQLVEIVCEFTDQLKQQQLIYRNEVKSLKQEIKRIC